MEKKDLHIRISSRRHDKLKSYAQDKEKTVTQLIEDWIDRLPSQKTGEAVRVLAVSVESKLPNPKGDSSSTPLPNQPNG